MRNKKIYAALLGIGTALALSGCAENTAAADKSMASEEQMYQEEAGTLDGVSITETSVAAATALDQQESREADDLWEGEAAAALGETADGTSQMAAVVTIDDGEVPLYSKPQGSQTLVPTASGAVTYGNAKVTIDASNTGQGYVMVKYSGSCPKIKVQISNGGGVTYTYDLNARDSYEVFPFTEGNGTYSVKVFENISGNQYSQAFSENVSVSLENAYLPFLYPNQYVNFTSGSSAVQKGAELVAGETDQIQVVTKIYNYVIENITYDTAKAQSVTSGYLPNVDNVLSSKSGICFDYAALMTAMLRTQNIPTKLVVGYTGNLYHAWINVYIDNVGWVDNMIYFDGQDWKLMDPTFASSGKGDPEIAKYIGDGANYQGKYTY